ncbi:MAG: SDR family oxidoreductase [Deltaproteobacteria bacterium]|nr:SDR family oxidoreductase [Deltaproteobacteria bacterium]
MKKQSAFDLEEKNVFITGATAGIGLGVAKRLVSANAEVIISGRRDSGADIAADIGARFVRMDVADEKSIETGIRAAVDMFSGRLDVLILNAGIGEDAGMLPALDMAVFRRVMDVNLSGVAACLNEGARHMIAGGIFQFLASDASAPVTGAIVRADDGLGCGLSLPACTKLMG